MNRERAKELLPIIQAFADGKSIQLRRNYADGWEDLCSPANFNNIGFEWRIKPEPRVFWINPSDRSQSPAWWLTQEEYESGNWDTKGYIKTIEDLSDEY